MQETTENTPTTPNPGSAAAIGQGCVCAIIDNYYGEGVPGSDGSRYWYRSMDCSLHGVKPTDIKDMKESTRNI